MNSLPRQEQPEVQVGNCLERRALLVKRGRCHGDRGPRYLWVPSANRGVSSEAICCFKVLFSFGEKELTF